MDTLGHTHSTLARQGFIDLVLWGSNVFLGHFWTQLNKGSNYKGWGMFII